MKIGDSEAETREAKESSTTGHEKYRFIGKNDFMASLHQGHPSKAEIAIRKALFAASGLSKGSQGYSLRSHKNEFTLCTSKPEFSFWKILLF